MTGRQVHRVVGEGHSLWSVQEALKYFVSVGLVEQVLAGRSILYTINPEHHAVVALEPLADPVALLRSTIRDVADDVVEAVLLFGSTARGEAKIDSDIDLAVVTRVPWDGRVDLAETVTSRFGNACEVVVFLSDEFTVLAEQGEPIIGEILRDGIPLLGSMPRVKRGIAR
jgi:predicted nucleotidyltransferase